MRYATGHKNETRERILKSASRTMKQNGIDGISIANIMKELQLTHGGFYAHFASKQALVIECSRQAFGNLMQQFTQFAELSPPERLQDFLNLYLSEKHLRHPAFGCPLPSLSGEISRQNPEVRQAFEFALSRQVEHYRQLFALSPADIYFVLSSVAGALMLARAVTDPKMASDILSAVRERCFDAIMKRALNLEVKA